jgi:hypothetical protein
MKQVQTEQSGKEKHLKSLETRISALGLKTWREAVMASLYFYVPRDEMGDTQALLAKFEKMERLSLLELAVLKAKAVDGVIFRHTIESFEQQSSGSGV